MSRKFALAWLLALCGSFALGFFSIDNPKLEPLPIESFREAFERPDPLLRTLEMSRFLRTLRAEDLDELIEFVESRQRWFDETDLLLLMTALVEIDESQTLDWALAQEDAFGLRAQGAVLEAMAFRNPIGARTLVDSQRDARRAALQEEHLIRGWARSDYLQDLTDYVVLIKRADKRERATVILAQEIVRRGTEKLADWGKAIPDDAKEEYKRLAYKELADVLAVVDPIQSRRFVQFDIKEFYVLEAVPALMEVWVEEAAPTALHWFLTTPEYEGWTEPIPAYEGWQRSSALLFREWHDEKPRIAEAWLRYELPSHWADPLVRVLVRKNHLKRPVLALDWAHLIDDPTIRMEVQLRVGREWFRREPDRFRDWLPDSGLDPSIQEAILKSPPEAKRTRS